MQKREKYYTEDQKEIIRFIKILSILVVIIALFYVGTRAFVTKDLFGKNYVRTEPIGSLDYDTVIAGTMLTRPEEEYYVLAYSKDNEFESFYSTLKGVYEGEENSLEVYYLDIDSYLNKEYISDETSNSSPTGLNDLKIKDVALIKVNKGKIVKYLETRDAIKNELSL